MRKIVVRIRTPKDFKGLSYRHVHEDLHCLRELET